MLSTPEITITKTFSVKAIVPALSSGRLTAVEVTTSFCKRTAIAQRPTNCIAEPLFTSAISRAKEVHAYPSREGKPTSPLHGLPISVKDPFD
ncbi:hypothetical protein BJ875DRAFT_465434 [Amylocarpus encephaloides]|uniref:Amidase domain-containing protein n=1 Tax=Amylocarpus encephaloides TaxID=45428 RepID=A0A9P7YFZ2_9HELO|nr:hypothetical protein BJ875DRAFT_465434 [Amylocarpus encephaloides]